MQHRIAVVGLGTMGRRHVWAAHELERRGRARLAACWDVDPSVRVDLPMVASSQAAAIERAEVVIVATPTDHHVEVAAAALRAGRHVLVEKPLASTAYRAYPLVALATLHRRVLAVGMCERHNPIVRDLHRSLAPHDVVRLEFVRRGPRRPDRPPADVLTELAIHDLDLAGYLTGSELAEIVSLQESTERAPESGQRPKPPLPDDVVIEARTSSGVVVHIHASFRGHLRERTLRVTERGGRVSEVDLCPPPSPVFDLSERRASSRRDARPDVGPLVAQLEVLLDAVEGRPAPQLASGLEAARLLTTLANRRATAAA